LEILKKSILEEGFYVNKSIFSTLALVVLISLISGCAQPATPVPPTFTPLPSQTPLPTGTPVPTDTPGPTKTPIPPTATIPAPDKVLEYLTGVTITFYDNFDIRNTYAWWLDSGDIKNGALEAIGNNNWSGVGRGHRNYKEGEGLIMDFTFTKGSVFEMLLDNGTWATAPYKRFGVYIIDGSARADIYQGANGLGGNNLHGNFAPKADTHYTILIAILPGGEFLAVIWDQTDPSKTILYREKFGDKWTNLTWKFTIGDNKGTALIDNFREITFDSVK
jgi:hypothetical protein